MAVKQYQHLGVYSDLVAAARKNHSLWKCTVPPARAKREFLKSLAFEPYKLKPQKLRIEDEWRRDGIDGQLLTWSVGYGPRTEAWLLRPAGEKAPLPGVLALHDHGAFKFLGKEKIATGPQGPTAVQQGWFDHYYGGRAFPDALARQGFCVLVSDVFPWGSRRFPQADIPAFDWHVGQCVQGKAPMKAGSLDPMPAEMSAYSLAAAFHEHTIQRYCTALGTNFAAIVAYEDRIAANYLASRKDVLPGGVGCIGLSGGGLRSTLLHVTSQHIRAAVVVGLMSTYEGMLDHNIGTHTWMLYPDQYLSHHGDWPDLAACSVPRPLMVQYDREDDLFTMEGMKAADRRIATIYKSAGAAKNYVGEFYDGPHKFDLDMQRSAFGFLERHLGRKKQ